MTDQLIGTEETLPTGFPSGEDNPALAVPPSRLEEIKARRERLRANLYVDLDLPSWQGDVAARYRVLRKAERDALQKVRFDDQTKASLAMMCKACIGLYVDDGEGNLKPILEPDGTVARFTIAAADALDVELPPEATNHDICRLLCDDNPAGIEAHANTLGAWMLNPTSPATTPAST